MFSHQKTVMVNINTLLVATRRQDRLASAKSTNVIR